MPTPRDRPYSAFNFLVSIGGTDTNEPIAGFQEVSGLGIEITMQEYRAGNWPENSSIKINGMHKITDVTLKRGVIGTVDLYDWLDQVRLGGQGEGDDQALRTIVITLQSEDRTAEAMAWKLSRARPIKYTGPAFNGKGTDVAVEELVLAAEQIEFVR